MGDILSQEEVDALLSAVSSTEEEEPIDSFDDGFEEEEEVDEQSSRALSLYDFKRPDRVSKDQMRTLQNLHEGYARLFSTTLTNFLRTYIEIELVSVDQLTYSEFIMSISNPSCIYVFNMSPLEGNAIIEINPSLVFFIIDRLFGGQGRPSEENRELTRIEQNVIVNIVNRALRDLAVIWEHVGIFKPGIESYETNPQFVQIVPAGETVILISLEVKMQNSSGLMSICYPYILLENVITSLSNETWGGVKVRDGKRSETPLYNELQQMSVGVSAVIGETKVSIRDFLQLQQGDILCLDKNADSDIMVKVGGKTKMAGKTGMIGRHKAIEITEILESEVPGCDE